MAKHRYWRAVGLKPHDGGGVVELSEFWLLNGATRADAGAALGSSVAPINGLLTNLQDANPATMATLAAGSTLTWDLGVATEITNIQVGAGDSAARFLLGCAIERSDDGVTWREFQLGRNWMGIRWPGARALTANVLRVPPIEHIAVRMSFEPAAWQNNEYGPAITFNVDAGATALTVNPIKGSRSVAFSGSGRLWVTPSVFAYAANMDFTVQAWVRATSTANTGAVIAAFGGISTNTSVVNLQLNPNTGVLTLQVTGTTSRSLQSPAGAFGPLNVNRHVAATSEGGTLRLFIDGVLVATTVGASTLQGNSTPQMAIGNYGGSATNTFLGVIDEVGIDQKALYFNDFTPPANIVPQPEWQIDAVTAAPFLTAPPIRISTAMSVVFPYGQIRMPQSLLRGRNDYLTGVLGDGVGRVKGTTKDKGTPNVPVSERVRLYRERDGLLIREVWSTAGTGAYSFDYVDELQTYTVISYDHDKAFRAVVADGLTLVNGGVELIA